MSMWVAGAVVVSGVAGAVASDRASDKAAKGQKKGMEQSLAITNQAREDVMRLFERSASNNGMGMKAALDYYKTAAPKRALPYLQGSQQAQEVIGQGAVQANNAILGLPVDMGFVNQPQIVPGTDHMLGAQIPEFQKGSIEPEPEPEPAPALGAQPGASKKQSTTDKLWANDPLNPNSNVKKKIKKAIKKIF